MRPLPPTFLSVLGFMPTGDLGPYTIYTSQRRSIVAFPRSPPKTPPNDLQKYLRMKFTYAASLWRKLTQDQRDAWERATKRASLKLTGYNLFTFHVLTDEPAYIQTVERISGESLL